MGKRILITTGILLVLGLTAGFVWANSLMDDRKPSEYKIGVTYEQVQKSEKPAIVLFYADWCGYCKKFMPRFRMISTLYKDKYEFVMLNVDEAPVEKILNDYAVTGFPTVFIYDPKYDNRVLLSNGIYADLGRMRTELDRYLRVRALIK